MAQAYLCQCGCLCIPSLMEWEPFHSRVRARRDPKQLDPRRAEHGGELTNVDADLELDLGHENVLKN